MDFKYGGTIRSVEDLQKTLGTVKPPDTPSQIGADFYLDNSKGGLQFIVASRRGSQYTHRKIGETIDPDNIDRFMGEAGFNGLGFGLPPEKKPFGYDTPITIDTKYASVGGKSANILCCPHCGDRYLRHRNITVFEAAKDNGNGERGGVGTKFICESCKQPSTLIIDHFDENTFIRWRSNEGS
jgi:hypothetical protein